MSYLDPLDILSLARVTSYFRRMLMTKDAKHVWRRARENVEMPECPSDMSEPFYVSLVCDRVCMVNTFLILHHLLSLCYSAYSNFHSRGVEKIPIQDAFQC